ncbi:MAG TPA: hypothetical protein VHE14_00780, partial [Solirubrobacteraceae bacterium]|nr:hypothetical protein [Solirubrobacteraceae bacterium]
EPAGARRAAFCRLEHVVPWVLHGAHWEAGDLAGDGATGDASGVCSECDQPLGDTAVTLRRHRGEHRIADAFCGVDHLRAWAQAGGRWA